MIFEYFTVVVSAVEWLLILGLGFLGFRFVSRRIRSPLAEAAFDCLVAERRGERPGLADAEIFQDLRRDPDLVGHAIDAFVRRHPQLPHFSGSWKFRLALRRQLAAAGQKAIHAEQAGPSLLGPIAGGALMVAGLPAVIGGTLLAIENGAGGAANKDRSIEVFYVAFTGMGLIAAALGAALCLAGVGLILRYRRLRSRMPVG